MAKIFSHGNAGPHQSETAIDERNLVSRGRGDGGPAPPNYRALERFATWPISTTSANDAIESVLAGAGAALPARDEVDQRVISEVKLG